MIKYLLIFSMILTIGISLIGCQGDLDPAYPQQAVVETIQVTVQPQQSGPTMEPYVFETSQPGAVTIKGMLMVMDPLGIVPAPDDGIYLVSMDSNGSGVTTIPQFVPGETPQADVDERNGEFVFTNIQPGKYAIVVLTPGGAQIPARFIEDASLAIITVEKSSIDQTVELELLRIP
jgi:hypothetical protein